MHRCGVEQAVIGTIAEFYPAREDVLICAINNPRAKLAICEQMRAKEGKFINVIHPTACIGPRTKVGQGVFFARFSGTTVDAYIGDFVIINSHSGCGHDAVIEDGCTLSSYCDITGHAYLERGVFLGSHASVMPGIRVGEFAVVGAGSVAFRNVKPGQTVVGVPAKVLM
jgi:sugar O-acyltransferase (sialic acid O-acetyltransferase NeuD family)